MTFLRYQPSAARLRPLAWSELDAPWGIRPLAVLELIAKHGDLFAEVLTLRQSL